MSAGADRDIAGMIASTDSSRLFFKVKADPRVTPVGATIRKYSLDELPQFFNVLFGSMSVVGPRPQVQREVDAYDETMRRRLPVKPGVTGQWQVSGRSNLSAAESIRHDIVRQQLVHAPRPKHHRQNGWRGSARRGCLLTSATPVRRDIRRS
jgi:lipopolysaccharide/colanic/teichoic acid biosynthesis glycosyltransferase